MKYFKNKEFYVILLLIICMRVLFYSIFYLCAILFLILSMREKYNMSSVIITHDVACVEKTADRILILDDGEILAAGSQEEIRNKKDRKIRSYFESE